MFRSISEYCASLESSFDAIPAKRKRLLEQIAAFITSMRARGKTANLSYICTHNSRRSHFGQVWSQVACAWYGIDGVNSYSGGTVATAFNPNAIAALERIGFRVKPVSKGDNPHYEVRFGESEPAVTCFSKLFGDKANPNTGFAAILTCGEAESECPFVPGADLRISTTYDDPKEFDGTPLQDAKYDERCRQIALETFYAFSLAAGNNPAG